MSANPAIDLSITSTNAKTHERLSGADIGVVVSIDLPNRKGSFGHLIQVKQSRRRTDPAQVPVWQIDPRQLDHILGHEPTAVYWLLAQHSSPKVLCVPATLVKILTTTRNVVHYPDVRSAAVPLSQHLVDLLIGAWLGSSSAVDIASGKDSNHRPAHLLQIHVQAAG